MTVAALRRAALAPVLVACMATAGCSLVDPYVDPAPEIIQAYDDRPSLDNAVKYAESQRKAYLAAISDQAILSNSVALSLVPMAGFAAWYGITAQYPQTILALALIGAGTYISTDYLVSKPRQLVYAAGADAITCTLGAIAPLQVALERVKPEHNGDLTLSGRLLALKNSLDNLRNQLAVVEKAGLGDAPEVAAARRTLADGQATLRQGMDADAILAAAGQTLYNAVQHIRDLVTKALIETQPNLAALAGSLASALPVRAGQIATLPAPLPPKVTTTTGLADLSRSGIAAMEAKLEELRQEVEQKALDIGLVIALVSQRPSDAMLKACGVGIESAGVTFVVNPTKIELNVPTSEQTVSLVISGGKPPYGAEWVGLTPAIAPDLTYSADGTGIVRLKIPAKTAAGRYQLRVHDGTNGESIATVDILAASTEQSGGQAAESTPRALGDPLVARIQRGLAARGKDPGTIDGQWGDKTTGAVQEFLAGATPDEANYVNREKLAEWLDSTSPAPADWRRFVEYPAPSNFLPDEVTQARELVTQLSSRKCIDPVANASPGQVIAAARKGEYRLLHDNPDLPQTAAPLLAKLQADTNQTITCKAGWLP